MLHQCTQCDYSSKVKCNVLRHMRSQHQNQHGMEPTSHYESISEDNEINTRGPTSEINTRGPTSVTYGAPYYEFRIGAGIGGLLRARYRRGIGGLIKGC